MKYLPTAVLMLTPITIFGCNLRGQTGELAVPFTLKLNESKKIAGADIEVTVNRIGRKWLANGGESLDLSFTVAHNGKIESYSSPLPDSMTAGDYKIEVVKTEPFGDGYAIFVVTKKDSVKKADSNDEAAAKFVESFGWHIDESVPPTKIQMEFPKDFNGLPFFHYQASSKSSGVDMTLLLGKTVEMLRYTLQEKQKTRGSEITNFAHLIIENGKIVGAWRTDSSASAPGIYSFGK